jgi:sugar O-acyltransferase (sialic acid O-acetyltransferase NeuD family)
MKDIILIGGGGHCKSVIDVVEQEGKFRIVGIVDKPELFGSNVLEYPIIGSDSDLANLVKNYKYALITTGQIKSSAVRIKLYELATNIGYIFPKICSPRAYISRHSKIGNGTIVMHDVVINANTEIGDNCIINSKALIEHDCKINSHCHISTRATINGNVTIGKSSFIGSNSIIKQGVSILRDSFIKAGSINK